MVMEQHEPDVAESGEGVRAKGEEYRIKLFEPESRKFLDADQWKGQWAPSMTDASLEGRKYVVPDPLSKFPSFQFVNSDGQGPGSPASRSAARAHVMRQIRKERDDARRSKQAAGSAPKSVGSEEPIIDAYESSSAQASPSRRTEVRSQADCFLAPETQLLSDARRRSEGHSTGLESRSGHSRASSSSLIRAVPAIGSPSSVEVKHIHHYLQVFVKPLLPMSRLEEAQWFWKALDDEACYHSTLFVSKAHQAVLTGRERALDLHWLRHKGEAISKINKRLSESQQVVEEGTIAAIACLAVYENLLGSPETATIHLRGLETIGNLRGGFHGRDMPGFLERLVHWVELSNATAVRERSRFVRQDLLSRDTCEIASADPTILNEAWGRQMRTAAPMTITLQVHKGMTLTAAIVFHRLQQLSYIRAQVQLVRDLDAETLYQFTKNVTLLERYINTVINWGMRDCLRPEQCMPLYGSALAFIYVAFRDIPVSSAVLGNLTARFKRVLSGMGMEAFCQHFSPELLLWILFLMTWIAQGHQDRLWYFNAMTWVVRRLELSVWEEVKIVLAKFGMLETVCEAPYRKIWIDLGL